MRASLFMWSAESFYGLRRQTHRYCVIFPLIGMCGDKRFYTQPTQQQQWNDRGIIYTFVFSPHCVVCSRTNKNHCFKRISFNILIFVSLDHIKFLTIIQILIAFIKREFAQFESTFVIFANNPIFRFRIFYEIFY